MAKKKAETTETQAPRGPLTHTLGFVGSRASGYVPVHVVTQDKNVLGFKPLTTAPIEWSLAIDKLKIMSARFYLNRKAFQDMDIDGLQPIKGILHTIGIARLPDGRYVPISIKIDGNTVVDQAVLFSSPLALHEACSVYRARFVSFFVNRKLFIE